VIGPALRDCAWILRGQPYQVPPGRGKERQLASHGIALLIQPEQIDPLLDETSRLFGESPFVSNTRIAPVTKSRAAHVFGVVMIENSTRGSCRGARHRGGAVRAPASRTSSKATHCSRIGRGYRFRVGCELRSQLFPSAHAVFHDHEFTVGQTTLSHSIITFVIVDLPLP